MCNNVFSVFMEFSCVVLQFIDYTVKVTVSPLKAQLKEYDVRCCCDVRDHSQCEKVLEREPPTLQD